MQVTKIINNVKFGIYSTLLEFNWYKRIRLNDSRDVLKGFNKSKWVKEVVKDNSQKDLFNFKNEHRQTKIKKTVFASGSILIERTVSRTNPIIETVLCKTKKYQSKNKFWDYVHDTTSDNFSSNLEQFIHWGDRTKTGNVIKGTFTIFNEKKQIKRF